MDIELKDFIRISATLTTNDKNIINSLSMMAMNAKENALLSKEIAKVAMTNILKAQPNAKLPFFYVVDSIVKNVGSPYKEMFCEKIIDAFVNSFQSNKDHKIRIKLYNLRLTWKDRFPNDLMHKLDEQIKKFDPAWPLVTKFDPKIKTADPKKNENGETNSAKSSPDSTTPCVNRDPRVQKIVPKKRKSGDAEDDDLFTIDRHGDSQIKKVVNKKGRLEEPSPITDGLFGSKDIDLRITDDRCVPEKQWTSEDVFRMLKRKLQVPPSQSPHNGPGKLPLPPLVLPPLPAPRQPIWHVPVDGFPQMPHIGTDPRLLARCPFFDPFRTITIDGRKFLLYLDRIQPCIFVSNELHAVRFFCHDRLELFIDNVPFPISPNGLAHVKINRRFYIACLGGPGHELILNGWPYNVRLDGNVHEITVGGFTVSVRFLVRRPVQVNVQLAIPPYVCEWAMKDLFGSPQYLNMPPLNPLRNPKLQDKQASIFREELSMICPSHRPPPVAVNVDVHDLFQKLVATGMILPNKYKTNEPRDLKLDITKYSSELFKTRNDKEIDELHHGHQCDLCGTRFRNKDSKEFELHLDYHFYKNTTSVTSTRKSRDYVGGSRQWILGGSMRGNGPDFSAEEATNCEQKFRCPMFEDEQLNKCAVCMEGFEVVWDDEEDSFMLLDGQLHNGKVYHPICLEDADKQIENSDDFAQTDDDSGGDKSKIKLTDDPLEALEKVLQGKSESVELKSEYVDREEMVEEKGETEEEKGEREEELDNIPISPEDESSDHQEFTYESVNKS